MSEYRLSRSRGVKTVVEELKTVVEELKTVPISWLDVLGRGFHGRAVVVGRRFKEIC